MQQFGCLPAHLPDRAGSRQTKKEFCHHTGQVALGWIAVAGDGARGTALKSPNQGLSGLKVASAAHELRNPVETMTSLVYLLQKEASLPEKARAYVQQLEKELKRMRHLIHQILADYRQPASPTLIAIPDMLDTIFRFYGHKIAFKRIGIEKRYECDGVVRAHSEDLRQVFSNLVSNALEALRLNGKLTIHVYESRYWSDAERAGVRVVIADNGSGILPEHLGKIMSHQPFTTKGEKGTGIGLWVTAEILRKAGGSIRFRSSTKSERSGTVFSVLLPMGQTRILPMAA